MQPFCAINSGGIDLMSVPSGLSDRLLSIEVTDEAEDKSDRVTIELDDRARFSDGAMMSMPHIGTVVSVVMGFRGGAQGNRGRYLIDELNVTSAPRVLRVTGRSANMPSGFRSPRTQSYHQKTLGEIMQEVAGRGSLSAQIDPALEGIVVRHIDQRHESDMAFATRLAAQHDAVARPVDGKLAVIKRGTGKSASGKALPVITLTESMCSDWNFSYSARDEAGEAGGLGGEDAGQQAAGDASGGGFGFGGIPSGGAQQGQKGGVRAYWTDMRTGEAKEVTVGKEPFHDLRYTFHNESEATAAVDAYKNQSARGKASFSCTLAVGDPRVQAEAILLLPSFRPYIPVKWRIKTAVHRFEPSGYTNRITAELFEPEQADVPKKVSGTKPAKDDLIDEDAPKEPVKNTGGSGGDMIVRLPGEE